MADIAGLEPGEHLRPAGRARAGVGIDQPGVGIGERLARAHVELLAAPFGAEREGERIRHPRHVEGLVHVQVDHVLGDLERTGVELGGRGRAQAAVERVLDVEIEVVDAVVEAQVQVPAADGLTAQAGHDAAVVADVVDLRQEAVGIDLRDVARVGIPAEEPVREHVALAVAGERIQGDAFGQRQFGIERERVRIHFRIAEALFHDAVERLGAVGLVLVPDLCGQVHEAVAAQLEAGIARQLGLLAVAGAVLAAAQGDAASAVAALEHHVDHAGDRVRAVLCRGAVAQHFHPFDGGDWNRIEVHRRRAASLAAVEVDQRGGMAALAVDQHQHLVGRQPAQLRRTHRVGAVGNGRAREIERGQGPRQRGGQLHRAGRLQRFRGDDVDRRGGFGHRAVAGAGAGDDQGVERPGLGWRLDFCFLGGGGGAGQCGQECNRERSSGHPVSPCRRVDPSPIQV